MLRRAKAFALRNLANGGLLDRVWGWFRATQLRRYYRRRRSRYSERVQPAVARSDSATLSEVAYRLQLRGYSPPQKRLGEVRTCAFIPQFGWHGDLLAELEELGPVQLYDYVSHGYTWRDFYQRRSGAAAENRRRVTQEFIAGAERAYKANSVDWVFLYASGGEIEAKGLAALVSALSVPVVGLCLDDKQSWNNRRVDGQDSGQVSLAPHLDIAWTSARAAVEWYHAEGGRAVYRPEGFRPRKLDPVEEAQALSVSFVGAAYGYRRRLVRDLRQAGISVHTYGFGWPSGPIDDTRRFEIYQRSLINLGIGGIGYSSEITNVKGRDFEVPSTGGGVYLTSYNADLAQHFRIGQEVLCYGSVDEAVDLIRHYVSRPSEVAGIAEAAKNRCHEEHRWLHRFEDLCEELGILA